VSTTVFITGGSGLLALNGAIALRDRQTDLAMEVVLGVHHRHVTLAGVTTRHSGLETVDQVGEALDAVEPGIVIHTAGLTSVEACEADPALARHVNVGLAANVATACARRGVALVHISSDHLFRGDEAMVEESHQVAPQNVYGRTKAEAEQRVLDAHPSALVARTNFYGWGTSYRRSLSDTILKSLRAKTPMTLFTDVFVTPLPAGLVIEAVVALSIAGAAGIVHVVGDERVSKHDFGMRIARCFELDSAPLRPGVLADVPGLVRRPRDMSLSNRHACALLGRPLGGVDEQLVLLRQQEDEGQAGELQAL
jgi:dTDP-4-dehydrorhamnose reductase